MPAGLDSLPREPAYAFTDGNATKKESQPTLHPQRPTIERCTAQNPQDRQKQVLRGMGTEKKIQERWLVKALYESQERGYATAEPDFVGAKICLASCLPVECLENGLGSQFRRTHGQEHAGRKDRIHKARRVTNRHMPLANKRCNTVRKIGGGVHRGKTLCPSQSLDQGRGGSKYLFK
jgi:hypothetical protein